eukprot:scaffold232585_cov77-Attheya_sp.AAC.3
MQNSSTNERMLQDFFKHKKVRTICNRSQTIVLDDENAGASGRFECQGHSAMITMQQYAKWHIGYGMFSTWVPLVQIETALIGDDSGGSRLNNYP